MATLQTTISRGLRSAQPAAASVSTGALYFVTDENKLERNNGASWDSFSSPSGLVLEQHAASSSASLDFTTGISSSYDDYWFSLIDVLVATSTADLRMLVSTNGGSTWAATGYYYAIDYLNAITAGGALQGQNQAQFPIATNLATSGAGVCGRIEMRNPAGSLDKSFRLELTLKQPTPNWYEFTGGLWWSSASAINAVRFIPSTGNIASGTIRLYGVSKI